MLVHLYEDHQLELVHHLRGMYAFAIWDSERKRVVIGRDRRGIKPMYLASLPQGGLAFASSISALLGLDVSRDPNPGALAEYFRFGRVGEPRTAYREVRTLMPGHTLTIDVGSGTRSERPFYSLPRVASHKAVPRREAEQIARSAFEAAVASHMVADVEVGAFLSGGIDSSLVVAEAQRIANRPLRTFAVGFAAGGAYQEAQFAEQVAAKLQTRHVTLEVSEPPIDLVRRALQATHQPFAVASFLPLLMLAERAAQDVKVVLTGDGGDEVGFGYPWYRWARLLRRVPRWAHSTNAAQWLRKGELMAARHHWKGVRRAVKFARGAVLEGPSASDAWRHEVTREDAIALLSPEFRDVGLRDLGPSPTDRQWDYDLSDEEAMRRSDLEVLMRDEMLPKLDRAGMAHGLEGRVPLLDDDFVEAMMAVPIEAHTSHPEGKALLRAWSAELCSAVDVQRPKHGFDVPIGAWLRSSLYPGSGALLERSTSGLVDRATAQRTWSDLIAGIPGAAHAMFALLLAELWYENRGKPFA